MNWKKAVAFLLIAVVAVGAALAGGKAEEQTGESATVTLPEGKFGEAPMLAERVQAGELPPVEERLPPEPVLVQVADKIGKYGGELKIGLPSTYSWFGDGQSAMGPETLLRIASDYSSISPNIIRDHEFSNDGKTWTVHLIEGAKWSDGDPFDADDLMFWYNDILLNEELTPSGPAKTWSPGGEVMKMTKIDQYTIRYDFAVPYPAILYVYSHYPGGQYNFVPSHFLKQFHADYAGKEKVEKMAKHAGYDQWVQLFSNKNRICSVMPCGEGLPSFSAHVLKSTSPDLHVLERNPYYWKVDPEGNQLPYIDRVRLFIYQDSEVLTLKAIQGEFSIFAQNAQLADFPVYQENKEKGGYEVYRWTRSDANLISFNFNLTIEDPVKREIFRDRRFRIAFSHALNRDEVNETRFFGLCQPMAATAHPRSPYYKEEYANSYIEYDPDRSNELLDEMGLTERDGDGYRLLPDGRRFRITLEYPPDTHLWMPPVAELVKDYMADVGIEMLQKTDDRSLYGQRVANNEVEFNEWATVGFTNTMIRDPRCFIPYRLGDETIWYQLWSEWYVSGGERGEEPIPEVKQLLAWYEEMISTVDEDARNAVIDKILKSHAENLWTIGTIGNIVQPVLVDTDLGNVPTDGVHGYDTIRMQPNHPEQFYFKNQ